MNKSLFCTFSPRTRATAADFPLVCFLQSLGVIHPQSSVAVAADGRICKLDCNKALTAAFLA